MPSTDPELEGSAGSGYSSRSLFSPSWSGSPVAVATTDEAFLQSMLDVEAALAEELSALGQVPATHATVIRSCAVASRFPIDEIADRALDGGNPVIPLVAALKRSVDAVEPGTGTSVHLGATSQDIIDSALMLVAHRSTAVILADLGRASVAAATLARNHRATVMAGRTLTQHATPITFGLKAARWLDGLTQATDDLRSARRRLPIQFGGASGTLAASARRVGPEQALTLADGLAERLGLAAPALPWHTQRLPVTRCGDALAGCASVLGTIAADTSLLARTEIAEVSEAGGDGAGGSSAMPQKRNPVLGVLVTAACAAAPGRAADLHRAAVSVDERPPGAWHTEWATLRDLLRDVGGAARLAATLLEGLTVDTERMAANLGATGGLVLAERLSVDLGPLIGAARVRQIVSDTSSGRNLKHVLLELRSDGLPEGRLGEAEIDRLLDPAGYLGCADLLVDRALAAHAVAAGEEAGPSDSAGPAGAASRGTEAPGS